MPDDTKQHDRTRYIGGSDVAAVLGVSKWKTPVRLWQEKTGQLPPEIVNPVRQRLFDRGHRWEPIALEMLTDVLEARGHSVTLVDRNCRYKDREHPFMACEIDAEILLDGELTNVELKTVSAFAAKEWGEMDTDEIPIAYNAQAMYGLGITERRRCIVGCLIGADSMTPYTVIRDDETIAAMRERVVKFWTECVIGGEAPDPIEFADFKALFPRDDGNDKEADDHIAARCAQLRQIKAAIKSYTDEAERIEFEIQDHMRPASALTLNGKVLATWKAQTAVRFDQKAFGSAHPDLYAQFKQPTAGRVFRLK